MLKKTTLLILLALGVLTSDDISHPHRTNSLTHNLRSFDFPNSSQHEQTCNNQ